MHRVILFFALVFFCTATYAQLQIAHIFQSNMVLQQKKTNPIWGMATPNAKITITCNQKKYVTKASADGNWSALLASMTAGTIGIVTIESNKEKITLQNVAVGEVWLCGGQSNMDFTMQDFKTVYQEEINTANNKDIRFMVVQKKVANKENTKIALSANWQSITTTSITDCSAVGYFYAKKLYEKLKIPIGLVNVAWSGTPAQAWVDQEVLKTFKGYKNIFEKQIVSIEMDSLEGIKKANALQFKKDMANAQVAFKEMIKPSYNNSDWEKVSLPTNWENHGYPNIDGIGVYQIHFNVDSSSIAKTAVLHLPAIDDVDSTYMNGVFIGSHNVWNEKRIYSIPVNLLKIGKNTITIWVRDDGGGGGLDNDTAHYYLAIDTKKINLKGLASFKMLATINPILSGINYSDLQNQPTVLFNGMIAPLLNYGIRGAIWYQGESNVGKSEEYKKLFPALIHNWRKRFKQGTFPFFFVQLASYNPSGKEPAISDWAYLREAQTAALQLPNTGMAVTIDIGDEKDIHPTNKKTVGERLAANAFKEVYGYTKEIASGPVFKSFAVKESTMIVSFTNIGKGLMIKGNTINGFAIAGVDKIFLPAQAVLNNNTILLQNSAIVKPVYIRYAWANAPLQANVYNLAGFPALPFRTDK
jgi:sialate O-acetylesterase